jgi:hypothetical protein
MKLRGSLLAADEPLLKSGGKNFAEWKELSLQSQYNPISGFRSDLIWQARNAISMIPEK